MKNIMTQTEIMVIPEVFPDCRAVGWGLVPTSPGLRAGFFTVEAKVYLGDRNRAAFRSPVLLQIFICSIRRHQKPKLQPGNLRTPEG